MEETKTQEREPRKKIRIKKDHVLKAALILGALIIVVYLFGCFYYHNRFMSHTTINDIDVSGFTYEDASSTLEKALTNQTLSLTFVDGEKETLKQTDSGISFNQNNSIQKALDQQNYFLWFTHFFQSTEIQLNDLLITDQKQLEEAVNSLQHVKDKQIAPVDAKVEYKDDEFVITPEVFGTTIQNDQLINAVEKAFQTRQDSINLKEQHIYKEPQLTSQDETITNLQKLAKEYCDAKITYQTTSGQVVLDGNDLIQWLSIDEKGNYYYDEEEFQKQATKFVKETLAPQINIIRKAKTFTGANGTRTVSGGNYGYKLNQSKEVTGLLADIKAHKKETRTPVVTGVQASYSNGGIGHTFVEIDLTGQHMWFVKNGNVVLQSDIVSGLPSDPDKRTPGGTYYIYFMQRNRTLIGEIQEDGKPEYETPVAYWMAFNGGIGLHDATWQSAFGGDRYKTYGSHGCINLPLDVAASLYSQLSVNIPVVCYY